MISSLRATLTFQSQTVPDQHGRYNWNFDFRNPEQSQFDMLRDESYVKADRKGGWLGAKEGVTEVGTGVQLHMAKAQSLSSRWTGGKVGLGIKLPLRIQTGALSFQVLVFQDGLTDKPGMPYTWIFLSFPGARITQMHNTWHSLSFLKWILTLWLNRWIYSSQNTHIQKILKSPVLPSLSNQYLACIFLQMFKDTKLALPSDHGLGVYKLWSRV